MYLNITEMLFTCYGIKLELIVKKEIKNCRKFQVIKNIFAMLLVLT